MTEGANYLPAETRTLVPMDEPSPIISSGIGADTTSSAASIIAECAGQQVPMSLQTSLISKARQTADVWARATSTYPRDSWRSRYCLENNFLSDLSTIDPLHGSIRSIRTNTEYASFRAVFLHQGGFTTLNGHRLRWANTTAVADVSQSGGPNICMKWSYFLADDLNVRLVEIRQACLRDLLQFQRAVPRRVFESIRQSLSVLLDPESWEDGDKLPSLKSFLYLLKFVSRHGDCRAPGLTISNDGHFVATWIRARENLVRLEFRSDGSLNWLFILAPVDSTSRGEQGTGDGPISKSEKVLTDFAVWEIMQVVK